MNGVCFSFPVQQQNKTPKARCYLGQCHKRFLNSHIVSDRKYKKENANYVYGWADTRL